MPASNTKRNSGIDELVLTRTFDAPRELVFKAWTDAKQLAEWWGPKGFTNPVCDIDVRPGGAIRIDMTGPDGTVYPMGGTFREIVPPERLVFSATAFGGELETLTTAIFEDAGGRTKLTVTAVVVKSSEMTADAISGMEQGWTESLERLGELFPGDTSDREIVATRTFDAPRDLVWKLWTDRHHVAQWWGPKGSTNTILEMNVRPGGVWRFVNHSAHGDFEQKIVYVDIAKPERIIYDYISDKTFHTIVHFIDLGGKTEVRMRMICESAEVQKQVAAGASYGMQQALERLDQQLAKRAFVITRTFDAPRDLVFKVWTDPEHLKNWFGPKGIPVIYSKNDFRPGGIYHYGMRTPDGMEMWGRWVYREIDPPKKLVFINSFSDPQGGITRHPMAPDWPEELLSTITFDEYQGKTTVTVEWSPYNAPEKETKVFEASHASMTQGWGGTLDKLGAYLPEVK